MNQAHPHVHKHASPSPKPSFSAADLSGEHGTGALLRARREEAGLSIGEVAVKLRIKPSFIEAIENLHVSGLPQGPYAFGFVRSYATFLDLDPQRVLADFKREADGIAGKPELVFPEPPGVKRLPAPWIAGGCGVFAVVLALAWFLLLRAGLPDQAPIPALPDVQVDMAEDGVVPPASMLMPGGEAVAPGDAVSAIPAAPSLTVPVLAPDQVAVRRGEPSRMEDLVTDVPNLPDMPEVDDGMDDDMGGAWNGPADALPAVPAEERVLSSSVYGADETRSRVQVRAIADSWIQVSDMSGRVLFSRLLRAGETYHAPDMRGLSMVTGNAGGIEISVDGVARPAVGMSGQVVRDIPLDASGRR